MAVTEVGLVTVKLRAGTVPNSTAETLDIFVPTIPTGVPPVVKPLVTDNPVTLGADD